MRKNKKDDGEYFANTSSSKLENVTERAGGVLNVVSLLVGVGTAVLEVIKAVGGEKD